MRNDSGRDEPAGSHGVPEFAAGDGPAAMLWGIVVGLLQAATPLVFWGLDSATVYALGLVAIAAIYVAAAAITGSPWLLMAGLAGHGLKDLWQHRTHYVANTRWSPPFCMIVDWVVAAIIVVEIAAGMHFG